MRPGVRSRFAAWGPDLRDMARFAAPIVLIFVGMQSMGVVDTLMVGHLGGAAIASVALGNLYFFNVCIFGVGLLFAIDPIVAQALGANAHDDVARGVQRGLLMALVLSAVATLVLMPGETLLRALGQPSEVISDTAAYARRRAIGALPFLAFGVLRQTLQAFRVVGPVLYAVLIANLVNIFVNWLLIFGHWGAPTLGVVGSGYATAISMWVMLLSLLAIGWPSLRGVLQPWRAEAAHWAPLMRTLRLGVPVGTQMFFEIFAFGLTTLLMGSFGTASLAGHEIALNMASMTFMVPLGIAGAASAVVGRAIGRGDMPAARRDAIAAVACGTAFMSLSALVFLTAPRWLATAYTHDASTVAVAVALIPLAGLFQVFDGLQAVTGGVLRGAGDTRVPALLHLIAFWGVGIPLGVYLGFYTPLRERGLWLGLVAGLAAAALLQSNRMVRRLRLPLSRVTIES